MTVKNSKETSSQNQNPRVTWEGCSVLLHVNDGDNVLCARLTTGSDNRAIVDNNTAQSISGEDIEEMRKKGATVDDIIEALIANNATFEKKTEFSQPLATCLHNLQIEKMAINLQISEPWLREYLMQMSSVGGFVLSGTRITGGDQPQLH